jgi:formylglycine-generating enzyme required for sulfatase activity
MKFAGKKVTPTEDCPIVNVSWEHAKAYAKWLTETERKEGRVSRGGSWNGAVCDWLRSSYRLGLPSSVRSPSLGFRLVLSGQQRG